MERIKIGRLDGGENARYGIRIKDNGDNVVMETDDEGKLWLKNELSVETSLTGKKVSIGKFGVKGKHGH
jgi:hypothetical protein